VNCFGIGSGLNISLIKGAAKAGGGLANFILDTEEIGNKSNHCTKIMHFPMLQSVGIKLAGGNLA
jgi:hypothetical protein